MADRSQPDANNIHSLIAVSTADGVSPVTLWADSATHALVTSGGNLNGQATSANSAPIVIASDQSAVAVKGNATGSAVPANGFYLAGNLAGNLTGLTVIAPNDGQAAQNGIYTTSALQSYNGSNYDRLRGNESVSLLASTARTTTQTSADLINYNGLSNLDVVLDVTTPGTGSITVTINGKDSASGKYYQLLSGVAVTTASTNRYSVGPYIAAVTNVRAQDVLPRTFQIVVTANNANSITYSVGYNLSRDT